MSTKRTLVPGAVILGLAVILAACSQAVAIPPSPSAPAPTAPTAPTAPSQVPSQPEPTEAPSEAPTPSAPVAPSEPVATPEPSQPAVIDFELPMLARSTDDGVNVRTMPSLDAPLISGENYDLERVPNIRLADGELVFATMGPVVADGISWYQVSAGDGDVYWEGGWVAGHYLTPDAGVSNYDPIVVDIHGVGTGTTASADVLMGMPITVGFAATPMAGRDSCDIEVTVIGTDGAAVNVATETTIAARVARFTPSEIPALWQEDAGTVTLQVETDCSYAASLTIPQF